jgi:hypothetical protein
MMTDDDYDFFSVGFNKKKIKSTTRGDFCGL